MKLYHQAGFRTNWSIESFLDDKVGDGIIFSPVHSKKESIEKIQTEVKKASLFDPQFYIPDSQKSSLQTYDFFPEVISKGFNTKDFEAIAHESADMCIEFQLSNDFDKIIIPTRFFTDVKSNFTAIQTQFTVQPFLNELKRRKTDKDIFLTIAITHSIVIDEGFKNQVLNWVTSFPEISGVYLMCSHNEKSKQIADFNKLWGYIDFIQKLKNANLKVLVGYSNTEALLYAAIDPYAVTIGAYENTRIFSIDKFLENESEIRGPKPRLYMPKLLNWIRLSTLMEIKEDHPDIWEKIYTPTSYADAFIGKVNPYFTNPESYKHYFKTFEQQFELLNEVPPKQRITSLSSSVKVALGLYEEIENAGIEFFNADCRKDHLITWNRVLKKLE